MANEERKKVSESELYDTGAIRRLLDSEVTNALDDAGYAEDTKTIDAKIALSCLSIGLALYAHFGCKEFPDDRITVAICASIWMACFFTMMIIDSWLTKGAFLVAVPKTAKRSSKIKAKVGPRLVSKLLVSSSLPRYGTEYSLTFRGPSKSGSIATVMVEYPTIFTSEGSLLTKQFRQLVSDGLKRASNTDKEQ